MRIIHISSGRPRLKSKILIGLILALSAALITLLVLLALSMLLVGLPILVAGAIVYALLPKRRTAAPAPAKRPASAPDVLEGRFRVVDSRTGDTDRQLRND